MLQIACKLQSWDISESCQLNMTCDDFGMSLYDSMKNLQPEEVLIMYETEILCGVNVLMLCRETLQSPNKNNTSILL